LYRKTTLANGLRVVTATMPYTRSVAMGIFVGIGSRYETGPEAGISHFIEHMCFKGTNRRQTPAEISAAIEGVGGILNAGTDKEMTVYWCKVAKPHFALAMDVLVDMLTNSRFDAADIERERQVIIEEIRMTKDTPSQEVGLIYDELLWPDHPLGKDTAGTMESVTAVTRDMLLDFMRTTYSPANTVVAISGSIEHEAALEAVGHAFDGWNKRSHKVAYLPFVETANPRIRIEKRDTEQAHMCLGLPGLSLFDPKRFVMDMLNVILGEGMSSRLFVEIRDNMGLAYSIYSYVDHLLDSGGLTVCAGVEPGNLRKTVTATLKQLARFKNELVSEAEVTKAKELSKGRLLLRMEDSRNVNGWVGGQEILTNKIMTVDEAVEVVDAVTAEQIRDVARELLVGERLRMAVVGPIGQDEQLEKLLKL
jgi:predicted Zn-dependent peptidase